MEKKLLDVMLKIQKDRQIRTKDLLMLRGHGIETSICGDKIGFIPINCEGGNLIEEFEHLQETEKVFLAVVNNTDIRSDKDNINLNPNYDQMKEELKRIGILV